MLPIQRGTVLPKGYSLTTGKFSEAVLLFSNGTLSTVGESSTLRVSTFEQTPFDPGNKKLADIKSEPSQSTLALDLLVGDLVVQTKKLNKGSTFLSTRLQVLRESGEHSFNLIYLLPGA